MGKEERMDIYVFTARTKMVKRHSRNLSFPFRVVAFLEGLDVKYLENFNLEGNVACRILTS